MSRGRAEVTVAGGYLASEFRMFGVELKDRGRLVEEGVEAMKKVWSGERFRFRGRDVHVTPRPLQQPHPPVILYTIQSQLIYYTDNPPVNVGQISEAVVKEYLLMQNFPNPFNPLTKISYQIPKTELVKLKVYDPIGNEVASLVDGIVEAGIHEVSLDATSLTSDIYFYRLQAGDFIQTKKMVLLK